MIDKWATNESTFRLGMKVLLAIGGKSDKETLKSSYQVNISKWNQHFNFNLLLIHLYKKK